MPDRVPGSSTTVLTVNHRSVISRRAAVMLGTEEQIAMPVTASPASRSMRSRRLLTSSAYWSAVRSALVEMRQWWASSGPLYMPITVWVLPASMARSTASSHLQIEADVEVGGRIRKRTDGYQVGAGVGVRPDAVEGDPARHLDGDPSADHGDRFRDTVRAHVVEQDQAGAARPRLVDLFQVVALALDGPSRPPHLGPPYRLGDVEAGQVVVLHQHEVAQRAPVVDAA